MKASTLEKINGRMAREIAQLKRNVHKTENALQAEKLRTAELTQATNRLQSESRRWQDTAYEMRTIANQAEKDLKDAKGVWYRIGAALEARIKAWGAQKKTRAWNWWLVKRLNKPRVDAVTEAGYIPAKLIKIAQRYWEHDQERLQHDEEIVYNGTSDYTHYSRKPGLIRRLKILMGRA